MVPPPPSRRDPRGVPLETVVSELVPGGPVRLVGDDSVFVRDVQQDSRRVGPGDLYVARAGSRDEKARAAFLADAIGRGASAILREEEDGELDLKIPQIVVSRAYVRAALGIAASAVHAHPSYVVEVLGITGTNGKTTTSWLLGAALDVLAARRGDGPDCAVIGTVGARLGDERRPTAHTTPEGDELSRLLDWARGQGADHAAIEVSSHALDQGRLAGTRIRAAAFTNLTQDHLDYHGTMERYFQAKRRLFVELHPGVSVVSIDDDHGERLAREVTTPLIKVGRAASADVRVLSASVDARGTKAELSTPDGPLTLVSPLVGEHNLQNLTVALGVLVGLGVRADHAASALGEARAVPGRLEAASDESRDDITVLVDYAHTPDALIRVLGALRPLTKSTGGRLLCLFGCGGDRDAKKRAPMGEAVARGADVGLLTSDNPRTEDPRKILEDVREGLHGVRELTAAELSAGVLGFHVEIDRAAAIERLINAAKPGDVVLLAGKGHEDYQLIGTEKRPFDDVAEARRALTQRVHLRDRRDSEEQRS